MTQWSEYTEVGRRKILFLAPFIPCPVDSSDKRRVYAQLKHLVRRNEVLFLSTETVTCHGDVTSFTKMLPNCVTIRRQLHEDPEVFISTHLRRERFDLILLQFVHCAQYFDKARKGNNAHTPVLVDTHFLPSIIERRMSGIMKNPLRRLFSDKEHLGLKREETRLAGKYHFIMTSTADQQALYQQGSPRQTFVVENFIGSEYCTPTHQKRSGIVRVAQIGIQNYANRDGFHFFCRNILPHLPMRHRNLELILVGYGADAATIEMAKKNGVLVTGHVNDIVPYFADSDIILLPIRIGSGTRVRILEAGALAKAVVATSIAAEGFPFRNGQDLLIEDSPKIFAEKLWELAQNEQWRIALGSSLRKKVLERYTESFCLAKLDQIIDFVAAKDDH